MLSGGGYVQICIDGLLERLEGVDEQIKEAHNARAEAEQALEEKSRELEELKKQVDQMVDSHLKEIQRLTEESEHIKEANGKAQLDNKINSSLLTVMSREFRTPLDEIKKTTFQLENTLLDASEFEYVEDLLAASDKLTVLTDEIMDLAHLEAGTFELDINKFNLYELVAETMESVNSIQGYKDIEPLYLYDNKVPKYIRGDENRIRQILQHLIRNTAKQAQSGEILLILSGIEINEDSLMIIGEVEDPQTVIPTYDEDLEHAASTERNNHHGTGLGISLSKRLLERMDGSLIIGSQNNLGIRYSFSLTVGTADQKDDLLDLATALEGIHILLVVDNKSTREVLEATLTKWNMIIHAEESVREAFTYLKDYDNPCDLMILAAEEQLFDTSLIARPVKQIRPDLKMVLIRANSLDENEDHASLFDSHLPKPVNPEHLLLVIQSLMEEKTTETDN